MSTITPTREGSSTAPVKEVIISADSHVHEPHDLWAREMPWGKDRMPVFEPRRPSPGGTKPGGEDPLARVGEMAQDGVSAEVLYTTFGLKLFGLDDADVQEGAFTVFNDWLMDYCKPNLDRLWGIACISMYNAAQAVKELERCARAGLKGAMIWQVPHPDLPLYSEHYYPFWEAAQALKMPISLHILTGHNYTKTATHIQGVEHYRFTSNVKTLEAANGLFDVIWYGILERYPDLRIVTVENEIGWIPFYLQQWDNYYRLRRAGDPGIKETPSFYFDRQVYATFFNDAVGGHNFAYWGVNNCMWSSDYPHSNSTWPHSREVIQRDLGHLASDARTKLVRDNVVKLYSLNVPEPV